MVDIGIGGPVGYHADMNPQQAQELQDAIFRRMTPEERLECCFRWTRMTYDIARGAIRQEHSDWTTAQVDREVGRRITGIDVEQLRCG